MAEHFNCPNCGGELSRKVRHSKMVACPYCESTVLMEDDVVKLAGKGGVMSEEASLFELGRSVEYQGNSFMPIGQARFSYANGWWDEFWALDGKGDGVWISVDEGDIAIQRRDPDADPISRANLALGARVSIDGALFRVTEVDQATCEALRGEFPEELSLGDTYAYYNLSGPRGRIISLEYDEDGMTLSEGEWIDPYDVRQQAIEAGA